MNKLLSHDNTHIQLVRTMVSLLLQPGTVTADQVADPCLWRLAKANQLLLSVGQAVVEQFGEGCIPAEFFAAYEDQQALSKNTLVLMAELLPLFESLDLPILTIKTFLPFSFVDSNVDIVTAHPDRSARYVQMLVDAGFQHLSNLADLREPYKKMYGRLSWQRANEKFPKVHLHRAISWNGIDYLDLPTAASRAQKWCRENIEVPVPSPEDELLIMVAHAFFENKFITLHELLYLTYLTPQIEDWSGLTALASQFHWAHAFHQYLSIVMALASAVGLSLSLPATVEPIPDLSVRFPYLLPVRQTFLYSWRKLQQDLLAGHIRQLPRQLFSYSFVDAVWMYRKAWRKQRKVQSC